MEVKDGRWGWNKRMGDGDGRQGWEMGMKDKVVEFFVRTKRSSLWIW